MPTCTWRRTLPLEALEHGAHAGGAEALAQHGAQLGGAEALAHGAARCRQRCSNTVPTLAELKHLHNTVANSTELKTLAHGAAHCR